MNAPTDPNRPLNIVWGRKILDQVEEAAFMRAVLFSRLGRPHRWIAVEDNQQLPILDDVLVCSLGDASPYLKNLRDAGCRNVGLFHIGDELRAAPYDQYALADYVLRHYHKPDLPPHVLPVLNGWAEGIGPARPDRQLSFSERHVFAFFSGFMGPEGKSLPQRVEMLEALKAHRVPGVFSTTQAFGQGLGRASYAAYMGNTCFALCPGGNAPESMRLFDALELGALPVVIPGPWTDDDNALGALGPPPLVRLESWDDIGKALAPFLAGTPSEAALEAYEFKRLDAQNWWRAFQDHSAQRVADHIEASFAANG